MRRGRARTLTGMRILFAGTPAVAADVLRALVDDGRHEVVAALTRPDAARGRSKRLLPSEVAQLAVERGIEVLKPATLRDEAATAQIEALGVDCCVVVAYGALVPARLLALPRHGWVNVHYSLLPRWRGAAPVQRAIMAGDETTGVSIFRLVPELDAGPVLAQLPVAVGERDAGELLAALTSVAVDALTTSLDALEAGTAALTPQPDEGVTYAAKLTPDDARLDWTKPAADLGRIVRGCHPAPVAWTTLDGERFRVLRAQPADDPGLAVGQVAVGKRDVLVGTGGGALRLVTVQPQGRRPMPAADWGRGLHETPVFS